MSKNILTFHRVVTMPVDIGKARAQYTNPEIDFSSEERAKLLAIVDLVERQELGEAIEKYLDLNSREREYIMMDMGEVFEQLGVWGQKVYLDAQIKGIHFRPVD